MTQKYQESGASVAVTKLFVEPCTITQVKTLDRDGYASIQMGCGKAKHINKPARGHLKDKNVSFIKEFRITEAEKDKFKVGDIVAIQNFVPGDIVKVSGISKGKGFQGVVKRHGFKGQPSTHGHKDQARMPGTSGAGGKQHVFPGKRMPGRMGGEQVTLKNLEVIDVDEKDNILYIKGAIRGSVNGMVWLEGEGEITIAQPQVSQPKPEATEVAPKEEVKTAEIKEVKS